MPASKPPINIFYAPLLLAGVVFFVTACCYGIMLFKAGHPGMAGDRAVEESGLLSYMDEHGDRLLVIELAVLAVATVGTIGLDRWRDLRDEKQKAQQALREGEPESHDSKARRDQQE